MSSPTSSRGAAEPVLALNVRGGARICVPPDLGQTTSYILLEQEDWFEDEIRFVRHWLRPGMRVVDVGASYGLYTVAAARAVGREGRVWAFEPTPRTADHLSRTLELNGCGQVQLSRTALSDHCGRIDFAISTLSEQNAVAGDGDTGAETISVPAATLDDLSDAQQWDAIDYLKLDVEGHETAAIHGGTRFLERESPLVMLEIKGRGGFELGPLEPLAELGYRFYRLLPGPLILAPFDGDEAIDQYQLNLFACKQDRAASLARGGLLDDGVHTTQPQEAAWSDYIGSAPYAAELAGQWPVRARFLSASTERAYLKGLAAFAGSRDAKISASARSALLAKAMDLVGEAAGASGKPAHRISLARLAWETGQRDTAVGLLMELTRTSGDWEDEPWGQPFLAPGPRYDEVATAGRPRDWMRCAVTEQFEKLRAYSSTFMNETTLEVLADVRELPFCSAEVDRRWQLVRIAAGRQAVPECVPRLRGCSEENLNPEFWCGAERT